MTVISRLSKLMQYFQMGKHLSLRQIRDAFEVSRVSVWRDLEYIRNRMGWPICWDEEQNKYYLNLKEVDDSFVPLPMPVFAEEELHALFLSYHLLSFFNWKHTQEYCELIEKRLLQLMDDAPGILEIQKRVKVFRPYSRCLTRNALGIVSLALFKRRQLEVTYYSRSTNEQSRRLLSPQRIVYYKDNWYLDAWCHLRNALRSFSVDYFKAIKMCTQAAIDIPEDQLDEELASGYGIFSGTKLNYAHLIFNPFAARWASSHTWHPQEQSFFSNEHYHLKFPYSKDPELIKEILSYGSSVQVLAPEDLKNKIIAELKKSLSVYEGEG